MDSLTKMKKKQSDVSKAPGPSVYDGSQEENPVEWKEEMGNHFCHSGCNFKGTRKDTYDHFMTAFKEKFMEGESRYSAQQALYLQCQLPGEPQRHILMTC